MQIELNLVPVERHNGMESAQGQQMLFINNNDNLCRRCPVSTMYITVQYMYQSSHGGSVTLAHGALYPRTGLLAAVLRKCLSNMRGPLIFHRVPAHTHLKHSRSHERYSPKKESFMQAHSPPQIHDFTGIARPIAVQKEGRYGSFERL